MKISRRRRVLSCRLARATPLQRIQNDWRWGIPAVYPDKLKKRRWFSRLTRTGKAHCIQVCFPDIWAAGAAQFRESSGSSQEPDLWYWRVFWSGWLDSRGLMGADLATLSASALKLREVGAA